MSAIAGVICFDSSRVVDKPTVERLSAVIAPYGTDAQNNWQQRGALIMRSLLRTTPEDRLDRQPVCSASSGCVLVFDGRLDNRDELARDLRIEPSRRRLMSDSDLVAVALDEWEEKALPKFLGDFALARWDPRARRLLIARDSIGHRPLFWHLGEDFFAFASMPKALFSIEKIPRRLREDALHDYLCLMSLESACTLFESIYRLDPGEQLTFEDGKVSRKRFHTFGLNAYLNLKDPREYVEGLEEQLENAVDCRLRAVGPVASELSSGLDSGIITAIAAQILDQSSARLIALTGALPDELRAGDVPAGCHRDEVPGASALAAMYQNIDHVVVKSAGHSPMKGLKARVESLDSPVMNPCNSNWMDDVHESAVSRGARVVLNGWQGNLTISHDGRYFPQALFKKGRLLELRKLYKAMKAYSPSISKRWFVEYTLSPFLPESVWSWYQSRRNRGFDLSTYSAVSASLRETFDTQRRARTKGHDLMYRGSGDSSRLRAASLYRIEFASTCMEMNTKGLEPRSPAMDRRVIEYSLSMPERIFLHGGVPKWPILQLGKKRLPERILSTRTRGYQGADWFESMTGAKTDLQKELNRLKKHESVGKYVDLAELQRLLDQWPDSKSKKTEFELEYRQKLLRGLSVGSFIRYVEHDNL